MNNLRRWKAYKLEEAIALCQDKWILGVEGEKCVEALRGIGLAAITRQWSNWNQKDMAIDYSSSNWNTNETKLNIVG